MSSEKLYAVRLVMAREDIPIVGSVSEDATYALLLCLQHAGVIEAHRDDKEGMCFDILPPRLVVANSKTWATISADFFKSIGFNAVAAPAVWDSLGPIVKGE